MITIQPTAIAIIIPTGVAPPNQLGRTNAPTIKALPTTKETITPVSYATKCKTLFNPPLFFATGI